MRLVFKLVFNSIFFLYSISGLSTHIVGGEIGYKCLGNNQYEIRLNVYRDCLNASPNALFDDPASIGIFNKEGLLVLDHLVRPVMVNGKMIDDTLTFNDSDPCLVSPPNICVHTTTYLDTFDLPYVSGGYQIVYQRCCRNGTISNIEEPIATGATFDIELTEEALTFCNSSPIINLWPPIFLCYGQMLNFDHSASDDYDQVEDTLIYKLCQTKAGGNLAEPKPQPPNNPPYDTITWVSGGPLNYSTDNMLGLGKPLKIDSKTGVMTGLPELNGQFVVGLCIEEYNKETGNLLSVTRRDFQYNVADCGIVTASFDVEKINSDSLSYRFINSSLGANSFKWYFDWPNNNYISIENNPTHTYSTLGYFKVALIAEPSSNCSDTIFYILNLLDDQDGDGVFDADEEKDNTDKNDFCSFLISRVDTLLASDLWKQNDCDGDGISNIQEIRDSTNPLDFCDLKLNLLIALPPYLWQIGDCDNDGDLNGLELINGSDPFNACSRFSNVPSPPQWTNPPGNISLTCEEALNFNIFPLNYSTANSESCNQSGSINAIKSSNFGYCGEVWTLTWSFTDLFGRSILHQQSINVSEQECTSSDLGINIPEIALQSQTIANRKFIESRSRITNGNKVNFFAGESITLRPGFKVDPGGEFTARIIDCEPITGATIDIGINSEINNNQRVRIFPNPFLDILNIELTGFNEYAFIHIFDIQGRLLKTIKSENYNFVVADLASFRAGVYVVRITGKEFIDSRRIVKSY